MGGRGGRGLTKLKSYSVGHAAAALLSLHLFHWMKKIQILINKCIKKQVHRAARGLFFLDFRSEILCCMTNFVNYKDALTAGGWVEPVSICRFPPSFLQLAEKSHCCSCGFFFF